MLQLYSHNERAGTTTIAQKAPELILLRKKEYSSCSSFWPLSLLFWLVANPGTIRITMAGHITLLITGLITENILTITGHMLDILNTTGGDHSFRC
ncbi:hypothetical protein AVEN_39116-1 [Araneus ventricosus]|uniref:Uncharacterized protein n=1 Tax=Araneus ventricosus TaxID=182803 RepID=A0A4Y2DH72_ARAVE|nr:hypothetical protein AVEN_39116-1 [Araneus ventricosus]